jgi:hypothetical protein
VARLSDAPGWVGALLDCVADRRGPDGLAVAAGPLALRVHAGEGEWLDAAALQPSTTATAAPVLDVGLFGPEAASWPGAPPPLHRRRLHFEQGAVRAVVGSDGLAWALDTDRRVGARVALGSVPPHEHAVPLRTLLSWWAGAHGLALVHAAAASLHGAAVLVVGPPGAGKSTLALALEQDGWDVLGDDYCVLEPGRPPRVHPLYTHAKASAHTLELVGAAAPGGPARLVGDKHVVALAARPLQPPPALGAICVLEPLGDGEPALTPVPPLVAVRAMAPSTLAQQVGGWDATWQVLAAAAREVPAVAVRAGQDPRRVAALLAAQLDGTTP